MTTKEAREKISMHAGKTENFSNGYRYALKYGFQNLEDMRQVLGVSIHNFGNPIPKQNINRLFERFYRLDMFKSKKIEGTGLGLGIAQQIVHKHGGMIDVSSSAEKGTTFTVYLPVNL